jgi:large subunit ribosomal protein L21
MSILLDYLKAASLRQGGASMYAIIETCGRQHKVAVGDVVKLELLHEEEGNEVTFDKVLMVSNEGNLQVGSPYVENAVVKAKVLENGKDKKIIVFKFKPKKDYRRKQGHRQPFTMVEITEIVG